MFALWCSKTPKACGAVLHGLSDFPHAASVMFWLVDLKHAETPEKLAITWDHIDFGLLCVPPVLLAAVLERYITPAVYDRIISDNVHRIPVVDFIPLARHIPLARQLHRDVVFAGLSSSHTAFVTHLPNHEWYLSCYVADTRTKFSSMQVTADGRFEFSLTCTGNGTASVTLVGKGAMGAFVSVMDASSKSLRYVMSREFTLSFVAPAHLLVLPHASRRCN
jgi:hypothetical protein